MKTWRKIIEIDEGKCNGCGLCIPNCPEGALRILDGKARLVSEIYCDGLGACIGTCPQGAIRIEEREAEEFNDEAVRRQLGERQTIVAIGRRETSSRLHTPAGPIHAAPRVSSALNQWPIQLTLVDPNAPFFKQSDLLVVADCVPFAYGDFHQDFLKNRALVVGCPKFDDIELYERKLSELFRSSNVRSVRIVNMEVPCCYGLNFIVRKALESSGKSIPIEQVVIDIKGMRKSQA